MFVPNGPCRSDHFNKRKFVHHWALHPTDLSWVDARVKPLGYVLDAVGAAVLM